MGICRDKATTYLRGLGYSAVRHPDAGLLPLEVVGKQGKTCQRLGQLRDLVESGSNEPPVGDPTASADLSGKSSSSLSLSIGAQILGSFVGAMGGKLGVDTSYTNAKKMTFVFTDVTKKEVSPALAAAFMKAGDLSTSNPVLVPWVMGRGKIYLITEVAYSTNFTIKYEQSNGQAATVQLPELNGLAKLKTKVKVEGTQSNVVTFRGKTPLAFAFKCFEIGYLDGELAFVNFKPGAVALSEALDADGEPIEPGVCLADVDDVQLIDFG